jgi:hypothetical protein
MKNERNRSGGPPLRGEPEYERTSTAQKSKYTSVECFGRSWIVPTLLAATLLAASFVMATLPDASFGQTGEEATSLEHTSGAATYGEGFHEATSTEGTVEMTSAPEDTSAGHGDSAPVEQYYAPPSEGTLADTGGAGLWLVIGAALASLAVLGMMLRVSGLARDRAGASLEEPEDRRGGASHG